MTPVDCRSIKGRCVQSGSCVKPGGRWVIETIGLASAKVKPAKGKAINIIHFGRIQLSVRGPNRSNCTIPKHKILSFLNFILDFGWIQHVTDIEGGTILARSTV